jgi:hypothetical protein
MEYSVAPGRTDDQQFLALKPIASLCTASECPTVYVTDRDTLVVQGYAVRSETTDKVIPSGELLVEIPAELLRIAAAKLA